MQSSGVQILKDGTAAIVVVEGGWPIIVGTWFGAATESLVVDYFARTDALLARAKQAGERVVMVTDTYATSPPSAKVRTRIAELSKAQTERYQATTAASVTILENALLRGVFTALSWLDPTIGSTTNVASFDLAMQASLASLRAAGIPPPKTMPTRYRDPSLRHRTG